MRGCNIFLSLLCLLAGGCERTAPYPSRPITLVCPWAAGGGTDRVSRQIAILLEQRLGQPVSVVNATGGKGVTGHDRGLSARPDGHTLTMMTFELNTMHWAGLTDLTYEDCVPLVSVNEDYAALLVRNGAKWKTITELESDVNAAPGTLTASGTALGGAWHLALAGWLVASELDADAVTWVPSAGAGPSLQQLISGGVDMVCCSLPEARTLLESDQVRALGVMSPQRAVGFEQVPTFLEQGNNWTLGGWRGLAVPQGTPTEIVDRLLDVLIPIVSESPSAGNFAEFMETQKFDHTWRGPSEFKEFLAENDRKLGTLLKSVAMKAVNEDRFNPMTYPLILLGLIAATLIGLVLTHEKKPAPDQGEKQSLPVSRASVVNVGSIVIAIVAYVCLAERVGFLLLASAILFLLLLRFKTNTVTSFAITAVTVPILYFVFAMLLRVPLP
ncbi:MAG: tripartite tricarboxylate transporter substrate-binding protein [Planctomycetota bacterium]|nr:tripartite tricarboxylate transporter substrate-binding protein [Planctomycetota bacterium]